MAEFKTLGSDFIAELVKACLVDSKILGICKQHLKYQFLENEAQKKVLKYILDFNEINTDQVPTVGMIGQAFGTDKDALKFLKSVKSIDISNSTKDGLLNTLEDWLKKRRLAVLINDRFISLYNSDKQDEAMNLLAAESTDIVNFKLRDHYYNTVFGDYNKRQEERQKKSKNDVIKTKCPSGVHELDDLLYGGFKKGTSFCGLARSGVGKTTFLRWTAIANARIGKRVVVFHGEGTKEEHEDAYDAAWTGTSLRDMEFGEIAVTNEGVIEKARSYILANGGEIIPIYVEAFDSMSIDDAYEILKEIVKVLGHVDMALFDYLELFTSKGKYSNTEAGERKRRADIANKIVNIATDKTLGGMVTGTMTQANDIKPDKWNNIEYTLTRSDISEYKAAINPFSYFFTLNQTGDEYKNQIMRIFLDKLRSYGSGQIIRIYQAREYGRFYDSAKTIAHFFSKV